MGEVPGTAAAASRVARQFWPDAQFQESCPTTTGCFPLSPECHTKSRTDPASKVREDARSFAETEVAAPAPHIRDQFRHRRIDADTLCTSCNFSDSPLKTDQGFWGDCSLDLWSICKAESEELPLLWFRHRTLGLVHFEFELLRDEFRDALHHSLTGSLASHVDIAIICVTDKAMSTALQLPIEFIEYEVTQQRRKHAPYTKGNFQFERTVVGWRERYTLLDLRRK